MNRVQKAEGRTAAPSVPPPPLPSFLRAEGGAKRLRRNPGPLAPCPPPWVPASAGTTERGRDDGEMTGTTKRGWGLTEHISPSSKRCRKVFPLRVRVFNHPKLPCPLPTFHLLFSQNCIRHGFVELGIDQGVNLIIPRKPRHGSRFMVPHTPRQITCHPYVQGAIGRTGKNVDARLLHGSGGRGQGAGGRGQTIPAPPQPPSPLRFPLRHFCPPSVIPAPSPVIPIPPPSFLPPFRHSCGGRNPGQPAPCKPPWVPASAGTTKRGRDDGGGQGRRRGAGTTENGQPPLPPTAQVAKLCSLHPTVAYPQHRGKKSTQSPHLHKTLQDSTFLLPPNPGRTLAGSPGSLVGGFISFFAR